MDHEHASGDTRCIAIDEHVCLQPIDHSSAPAGVVLNTPAADAYGTHLGGFLVGHDRPGFDVRCEGIVTVDDCDAGRPRWKMTGSLDSGDLTLSPSIRCGSAAVGECGLHGHVRDGTWVPA